MTDMRMVLSEPTWVVASTRGKRTVMLNMWLAPGDYIVCNACSRVLLWRNQRRHLESAKHLRAEARI